MVISKLKNISFLFFLVLSYSLYGQSGFSIDWIRKEPASVGLLIKKDNDKNIITTGQESQGLGLGFSDLYIRKQDTLGNVLWSQNRPYSIPGGGYQPLELMIDSLNNIYLTGVLSHGQFNTQEEGFVIKYDSQGAFQWEKEFGIQQGLTCLFGSMTIYKNKYITVAGIVDSNGLNVKAIVAQYSSGGNLNWYHLDTNSYLTRAHGLACDKFGAVYAAYASNCCPPNTTATVAKFDTLGNELWQKQILDSIYRYKWPSKIALDDSSYVYLLLQSVGVGTGSGTDCAVVKLDTNGNQNWFSIYRDFPYSNKAELPVNIFFDKNNFYVYGYIDSTSSIRNAFLAKFTKNGLLLWGYKYAPSNFGGDGIAGASIMNDSIIFIGGIGVFNSSQGGMFFQVLDTAGNLKFNYQNISSTILLKMEKIDNSFYFVGSYQDTNQVAQDSSLTIKVSYDIVNHVIKMWPSISIIAFPNPFQNEIQIQTDITQDTQTIEVYNTLGKKLYQLNFKSRISIDTELWTKGVYFLKISSSKKTSSLKFLKQ